jgi:hypothetical protein
LGEVTEREFWLADSSPLTDRSPPKRFSQSLEGSANAFDYRCCISVDDWWRFQPHPWPCRPSRHLKEELDLDVPCDKLLCVEYLSQRTPQTESVHFVFYGGTLTTAQIERIVLPPAELSTYSFSPVEEALALLSSRLARRIPYCLQALQENGIIYLEDGLRLS